MGDVYIYFFFERDQKREKNEREYFVFFFSLQNKRQDVDMTPIIYR